MKLDIENKILFPFMTLLLLSITILGIVSYWNGYQLLTENQSKNLEKELNRSLIYINQLDEDVLDGLITNDIAKNKAIEYFNKIDGNGLVIIENQDIIINNYNKELFNKDYIFNKDRGLINNDKIMVAFATHNKWNWKIIYCIDKNIFSNELMGIQKGTLLIAIIFLVISMEATILIAYNISKPIKKLADTCNRIASGNLKEQIKINRNDEIGILADAFDNMMYKLKVNTKKLIKMKNFNDDILRSTLTGIITIDKEENIVSINKAAEKIAEKNMGEKDNIYNSLIKQLKDTLNTERNINSIYEFNKGENDKLYLDVTTSLLETEDGKISGAICSINDITERKIIENKIERVDRLTSVGQLAAGLAHEIRNPLSGIRMSIQVLKRRLLRDDSQSNRELFDGTLYEIDRMNRLITDLLNFAKPHLPKYEIVNIMNVLDRAKKLVSKAAEKKGVKINTIINAKNVLLNIDAEQIEQVFINIITNSINAVKENGNLDIRIYELNNAKDDLLIIEFKDNGCGIKEEHISKIFNPFFTTNSEGTGLGLSVVHNLVTENKGEIQVESKINIGTTISLKFPMYGGDFNEEKNTSN